jgi:hypothetical protein
MVGRKARTVSHGIGVLAIGVGHAREPQSVPLSWTIGVKLLDRERAKPH